MDVWKNKVAVVTGAGQGIGAQIARDLAKNGVIVIGFEATEDKVKLMLENIPNDSGNAGQIIPCKCDVSNDEDLIKVFSGVLESYGGVDILINNAAIGKEGFISTGDINSMRNIINVNIYGLIACSRLAIDSMKNKGKGHIININSISGHYMPPFAEPKINVYTTSKKVMTTYNEILRRELEETKQVNIKVSSISPGIVKTNLFNNSGVQFINDDFFETNPHLSVEEVSKVVMFVLSAPEKVCVKEMIVHAMHEIY